MAVTIPRPDLPTFPRLRVRGVLAAVRRHQQGRELNRAVRRFLSYR